MGWAGAYLATYSMLNGAVDSILLSQETIFTRLDFYSMKHRYNMVCYVKCIPKLPLFKLR